MEKNWICIYRSISIQDVELIRSILEDNNIEAVVLNKQDSSYPCIGEIELYVPKESFTEARSLIEHE